MCLLSPASFHVAYPIPLDLRHLCSFPVTHTLQALRASLLLTSSCTFLHVYIVACGYRHRPGSRRISWPSSPPNSGYSLLFSRGFPTMLLLCSHSPNSMAHPQLFCKSEQIKDVPLHATVGFRSVSY